MLRDRRVWLSITPEPERELPRAIATLRSGGPPTPEAVRAEREHAEQLVLHGSRRRWLAWLEEAEALAERTPAGTGLRHRQGESGGEPELGRARRDALAVIANHNALMRGLPGRHRPMALPSRRGSRKES